MAIIMSGEGEPWGKDFRTSLQNSLQNLTMLRLYQLRQRHQQQQNEMGLIAMGYQPEQAKAMSSMNLPLARVAAGVKGQVGKRDKLAKFYKLDPEDYTKISNAKELDDDIIRIFLKRTKGDSNRAIKMAKAFGFKV